MRVCVIISSLVCTYFLISSAAFSNVERYRQRLLGRHYSPIPLSLKPWNYPLEPEPTCEELRAMWQFSKRQSRATELTNEIPTYRDPFAYNVWDPYATSRSTGNSFLNGRERTYTYGRIVHSPPQPRGYENPDKLRAVEEVARLLVTVPEGSVLPHRGVTSFRLPGGGVPMQQYPSSYSSFDKLKNIIRLERARELQLQRMSEENSARKQSSLYYVPEQAGSMGAMYDVNKYGSNPDYDKDMQDTQDGEVEGATYRDSLAPSSQNYPEDAYIDSPQIQNRLYNHNSQPYMITV